MTSNAELTGVGTNLKPRTLYCLYCKTFIVSDEPNKRCEVCNHQLITVINKNGIK